MATTKKTTKKAAPKAAVKPKTVKKKAAVKKAPAKKAAVKKAPAKKAPAKAAPKDKRIKVTFEQRYKMICEAAYYISLEKNYETVNPTEDWLQAEAAIDKICTVHPS